MSFATVPCKVCEKPVVLALEAVTGRPLTLDPRPPTYFQSTGADGKPIAARAEKTYVSHFATCTHPSRFSGSKKA